MSRKHHAPRSAERRQPRDAQSHAKPAKQSAPAGQYWIYGWHAVHAALANPERRITRLLVTESSQRELKLPKNANIHANLVDNREIERATGGSAVHQGIAALVDPLPGALLEDVMYMENPKGPLLVLDQVSDPHNVGAILRSAAAFGSPGVIMPKDHSAPETAVMGKAACGALDLVARITVTNLASALRDLKENGWWVIGLDGSAKKNLHQLKLSAKTVLVLGAEGKGMRRLTLESCDEIAKLPIDTRMESLNVSNAAAIALYHCFTAGGHA